MPQQNTQNNQQGGNKQQGAKKNEPSAKEKREQRRKDRIERRRKKRDMNILRGYTKPRELRFVKKLRYRVIVVRTGQRNRKRRYADITGIVESVTWSDTKPVLTGALNVQKPKQLQKGDAGFTVNDGNIVKLDIFYGGKWRNIWKMRVQTPSLDVGSLTGSYELADDSLIWAMDEGDFEFKKDKETHPKPYRAHEVAEAVCKEWKIPHDPFPRGTEDLDDIEEDSASPLSVIAGAYKQESEATGKKYIMSYRNGRLRLRPLRRSKTLWVLREQILSATVTRNRGGKFFTALNIIGKVKDGKETKKVDFVVTHPAAARRYGRIVKIFKLENVGRSREKVVESAKKRLNRMILKKTQPTIQLSHVGIPWIRRGDALEIRLPKYGFKGKPRPVPPFEGGYFSILFLTAAEHTLDSSGHTMDLTFEVEDPVAEMKAEIREIRDKEKRKDKRKKRDEGDNADNN